MIIIIIIIIMIVIIIVVVVVIMNYGVFARHPLTLIRHSILYL